MTATVRELFTGTLNTLLDGKTADIGSTWRVAASTGTLNTKLGGDGTAYNTDSLDRAVNNTATGANKRVKAQVTFDSSLTGTRQVGLAVRIQAVNDSAGYYLVFSPTGWDFFKLAVGGAYTSIASGSLTIAIGTPFTCEVIPNGSSFDIRYNGTTLATPTDTTYPNGGFSGFHMRAAKIYWFEAGDAGDPDPEGGGGSAPAITAQPSNQSVTAGSTASFSITATGATSYQWQRSTDSGSNWSNVSTGTGGTTANYTTAATTVSGGSANNGDQFRCVATNSNGSTNSNAATLTVSAGNVAPSFTTQPTAQTVNAPNTATFSVVVAGTPTPTLQWQRSTDGGTNWNNVSTGTGGTTASYTTGATSVTGGGANNGDQYRCVATNAAGTVNSNAVALTVNAAASATLTVPVVNNTESSRNSYTLPRVVVLKMSDGTLVLNLTNQASNSSGNLVMTSTQLVAGTDYMVMGWHADGSLAGIVKATAT